MFEYLVGLLDLHFERRYIRCIMMNPHKKEILSIAAFLMLLLGTFWFANTQVVGGKHTDAEPAAVVSMTPPSGLAAADPNPDTAFREEDAGMSAYYRASAQSGGGSQPRLDTKAIVDGLTDAPEESGIRAAGKLVDWGQNFGIVELPLDAAVVSPAPVEYVTVYFDSEGWVVAYLSPSRPAAALWKYRSEDGASVGNPKADEHLERNLLVIAINEVLVADDQNFGEISPSEVDYYDWTCPQCDAFALFSGVANGGESDEIKFVVPYTIPLVRASAALVMAEVTNIGSGARASVEVDGTTIVNATADTLRAAADFVLNRDVESTSLHRVVVKGPEDNVAVAAVMLLYDQP